MEDANVVLCLSFNHMEVKSQSFFVMLHIQMYITLTIGLLLHTYTSIHYNVCIHILYKIRQPLHTQYKEKCSSHCTMPTHTPS